MTAVVCLFELEIKRLFWDSISRSCITHYTCNIRLHFRWRHEPPVCNALFLKLHWLVSLLFLLLWTQRASVLIWPNRLPPLLRRGRFQFWKPTANCKTVNCKLQTTSLTPSSKWKKKQRTLWHTLQEMNDNHLIVLCRGKKWDQVRRFLDSDSNNNKDKKQRLQQSVCYRDGSDLTCLHEACYNGAPADIIKSLIDWLTS